VKLLTSIFCGRIENMTYNSPPRWMQPLKMVILCVAAFRIHF
jgi:hypothetical protein